MSVGTFVGVVDKDVKSVCRELKPLGRVYIIRGVSPNVLLVSKDFDLISRPSFANVKILKNTIPSDKRASQNGGVQTPVALILHETASTKCPAFLIYN